MRSERKVDVHMTQSLRLRPRALLVLLLSWAMGVSGEAAEKVPGILTVQDALTLPNHSVRIEAQLSGKAALGSAPLGGVTLHLQIDGKPMTTAKTNEGGQASFEYLPKMRGTNVITVSVDEAAPVAAEKRDATLCVWERRRPILMVEMTALIQPNIAPPPPAAPMPLGTETGALAQPVSDAAEELSRLTQYYYNVVYVFAGGQSKADMASLGDARRWLAMHKFPTGLVAMPLPGGLSATIETFKEGGWSTLKSGVGRTRLFADTLLQHRMEVVVVPELPKGELPRKAKAAKDWKEVRKKL